MAIPEGYTPLAKIGIVDKGEYVQGTTYSQLDAVYYDGSTYLALIDNPVGIPTNDRVNWRYLARGMYAQQIENYNDLMVNTVAGYLPDALAVKEGFEEVNSNLSPTDGSYSGCVLWNQYNQKAEVHIHLSEYILNNYDISIVSINLAGLLSLTDGYTIVKAKDALRITLPDSVVKERIGYVVYVSLAFTKK